MKVDYYLMPGPLSGVAEQAQRAARLGFDGIFSADTAHEPFLQLVAASDEAPECDLGTAIAVAFARSPMTVAQTTWDLAQLSSGRFLLGLGTQIRAHITRRFSMPWGKPGPQMREYIAALRAIWNAWQNSERLRFRGDYYDFSLMTPFFDPGPSRHYPPPVYIAGVGEYMCHLAGEVCDGFHVHPFHTVRYLDEVVLPQMAAGAEKAGRSLDDVELVSTIFVVAGRDPEELATSARGVKQQIAFYASTPAYRAVLDLHGWDFADQLTAMSKRGEWDAMADVVPDEALEACAVIGAPEEIGGKILDRFGDRVQRVGYYTIAPLDLDEEGWAGLITATKG